MQDAHAGPSSFAEFAAERRRSAPPPAENAALPSGAEVAQVTIGDALVRTQQIMTKVALNPSNVLGYDLIHRVDPETNSYFF